MLELLETAPAMASQHALRDVLSQIDRQVVRETRHVGGAQLTPDEEAAADAHANERAEAAAAAAPAPHPNMAATLKRLTPDVALSLIFALIPEGAPVLIGNPQVIEARTAALAIVNELVRAGRFPRAYFLKHLRNVIVKATGRTPEQVLSSASHGDVSAFASVGLGQLGDFTSTSQNLSLLMGGVGAIISAIKPPKPATVQYNYPATPQQVNPYANQPQPQGYPQQSTGGLSSTAVTALAVGGGVMLLGVVVVVARRRK